MKRLLLLILVLVAGLGIAAMLWVRSFGRDAIRDALASQIARAIGQPVSIEGIDAALLPRVTITLEGVAIGEPTRIRAERLRLATNLRALFARRIEGATVYLDGATIELPLLPLAVAEGEQSPAAPDSAPPLEVVSIDEVRLDDVQIVSGGRTLRASVSAVPHGSAVTLRRIDVRADDTVVTGTGEITSLTGPVGSITLEAESLDLAGLMDFFTAFAAGSPDADAGSPGAPAEASPIDLTVTMKAARARMAGLTLDALAGRARLTPAGTTFDPIEFGVFGGRFVGAVDTKAGSDDLRLRADVTGVDVAALSAWAGSPGVITGRMEGEVDITTRAADPAAALSGTSGTARLAITDGVVYRLGLVQSVVVATSMRSGAALPAEASRDEPFSRLGATLRITRGRGVTDDLSFESPNVRLAGGGTIHLDGSSVNLRGNVQLSEALTKQAGRDLVRYTQEDGRVTLPVTITGSASELSVHVNVANVLERAVKNKVEEEITKGINRLLRRKGGSSER